MSDKSMIKVTKLLSKLGLKPEEFLKRIASEEEEVYISYVGDIGVDYKRHTLYKLGEKMIVEQDETDHLFFKCPSCRQPLIVTSVLIERSGYGTIELELLCPRCRKRFRRKIYANNFKPVKDIPKTVLGVFKEEANIDEKLSTILESILLSTILGYPHGHLDVNLNYVVDSRVLESPVVRRAMFDLGLSEDFLIDYPLATGDKRLYMTGDRIIADKDVFVSVFRGIVSKLAEKITPVKELSDHTLVYEVETDFISKPKELLGEYVYSMINEKGIIFRYLDFLRALKITFTDVMDLRLYGEEHIKILKESESFNDVLKKLRDQFIGEKHLLLLKEIGIVYAEKSIGDGVYHVVFLFRKD